MRGAFAGVVFDKDGTLLDFAATWNPAIGLAIDTLADGDPAAALHIAEGLGYDLDARVTLPNAPLMAASNAEVVALVPAGLGGERLPDLLAAAVLDSITAAAHADTVLAALVGGGVPAAVATNDDEASTVAQIGRLAWTERFVAVLGYDSGHGAKPEPGMVVEACRRMDVAPGHALMVGDSMADILAGRAAGTTTVYVGPDARRGAEADHWISALDELLPILGG
jgi:phosphoglycolate phosphatase